MTAVHAPGRWAERVISVTSILAGLALVLIVAGAVLFALPVSNPRVQSCGAPASFLLHGRVDTYVDPNKPPKGFTAAQALAANRDRCRKRVAARAVPGALLAGSGVALGLFAAIAEWTARSARRRALL
ncbi:MAG: hypothetical protein JWN46_1258, partial [Acidimicrobiales bacterium]|nr:hypothetical protein [Acidimicrobiales bacterium]